VRLFTALIAARLLYSKQMEQRHYRLTREVTGTALDDVDEARFPDDTRFPAGTEFVILSDKLPWPGPRDPLFYTIRPRAPQKDWPEGTRYKVRADALDSSMEETAYP
jgi:hypothetical protein